MGLNPGAHRILSYDLFERRQTHQTGQNIHLTWGKHPASANILHTSNFITIKIYHHFLQEHPSSIHSPFVLPGKNSLRPFTLHSLYLTKTSNVHSLYICSTLRKQVSSIHSPFPMGYFGAHFQLIWGSEKNVVKMW